MVIKTGLIDKVTSARGTQGGGSVCVCGLDLGWGTAALLSAEKNAKCKGHVLGAFSTKSKASSMLEQSEQEGRLRKCGRDRTGRGHFTKGLQQLHGL